MPGLGQRQELTKRRAAVERHMIPRSGFESDDPPPIRPYTAPACQFRSFVGRRRTLAPDKREGRPVNTHSAWTPHPGCRCSVPEEEDRCSGERPFPECRRELSCEALICPCWCAGPATRL